MATVIVPLLIVLLIAAVVLHLTGRRSLACWLVVIFPASLCVVALFDLSRGPTQLGLGAYQSDQKQLAYCLGILAPNLIAALRPKWWWLFWASWTLNAVVCGMLVYLAFFWKVFS